MSPIAHEHTTSAIRMLHLSKYIRLTNSCQWINQNLRICVGRCSKKLTTCRSSRVIPENVLCRSSSEVESYSTSASMDGFEPSGWRARAKVRPHALKLDPRCGVPKNNIALVCSATLAKFGLLWAWTSAYYSQFRLSEYGPA